MDFEITKIQPFNGKIVKVMFNNMEYFIGIGNYKAGIGMDIYSPQSGSNYIMVLFNNRNYRFHMNEFKQFIGGEYIKEKLYCTLEEAELVYNIIRELLMETAAYSLLLNEENIRNPFINEIKEL